MIDALLKPVSSEFSIVGRAEGLLLPNEAETAAAAVQREKKIFEVTRTSFSNR